MSVDPAGTVRASYVPGTWVALAGRRTWVLADLDQTHQAIEVLWELLRRDADHLEVLSALAGIGLRRIPDLVLASLTEGGLTVVLRGAATARPGSGPQAKVWTAEGVSTWVEHCCDESVGELELIGQPAAGGGDLPLSAGVVRACRLLLRFSVEPEAGVRPSPAASREAAPAPPRLPAITEAPVPAPALPVAVKATAAAEPNLPAAVKDAPAPEAKPFAAAKESAPPGAKPAAAAKETPRPQPSLPAAAAGETLRPVPAAPFAAIAAPSPVPESPLASDPSPRPERETPAATISATTTRRFREEEKAGPAQPGGSPPPPTPESAPPPPPPPPTGAGLIDSVPWAAPQLASRKVVPPAPPPVATPAVAPADDEGDGLTISREVQQKLLLRAAAAGELPRPGPTVHAVHCPNGHPNPAHAVLCRVCHAEIPDHAPVTVPRPVLGVLRMSTGDVVTLDRGVLMGRSPSPTRLVGAERPHLVKIPSPDKQISRNHLEIRLDGWHVLVTDLKSTNGTLVTLPGREPERLRPDAPAPIEPGTTVSLADEVTFRFEVVD